MQVLRSKAKSRTTKSLPRRLTLPESACGAADVRGPASF